jgi:hypothetical protein
MSNALRQVTERTDDGRFDLLLASGLPGHLRRWVLLDRGRWLSICL